MLCLGNKKVPAFLSWEVQRRGLNWGCLIWAAWCLSVRLFHGRVDLVMGSTFVLWDTSYDATERGKRTLQGSFLFAFFLFYASKLSPKLFILVGIAFHITPLEKKINPERPNCFCDKVQKDAFVTAGSWLCLQLGTSLTLVGLLN